jgi:DNA-binding response OmpR family regulator
VLVADDNVDSAETLAMALRYAGHEVRVVHDGQAALEAASAFRPDWAVLDIGMPRLNGYDVARRLRAQFGDRIRLLAMTGWGQDTDKLRATEAGFDHHVTKPADLAALLKVLDTPRGG